MDLLRWWRFLAAVEVRWDRAGRVETPRFPCVVDALGQQTPSRRGPPTAPYAPATLDHNLAVLHGFYADRMAAGPGPVVNPIPEAVGAGGGRPFAHHNPMEPFARHRRAPLRQGRLARQPRGLGDRGFDELFAAMGCDRDRVLLALYVSTGARASELLGVTVDRVDVGRQLIGVHRKGQRPAAVDPGLRRRLRVAPPL